MALTRKLLKGMGLTEEQVDTIIEAHTDSLTAVKEERDSFKEKAEKYDGVSKELETLKSEKGNEGEVVPKADFDKLKAEYDSYKTEVTAKETKTAKERAFRELLKAVGVPEKRLDAIVKVSDIDALELDKEGKLKDSDGLSEKAKTEWADFIVTTTTKGADTATPPQASASNGVDLGTLSMKEYIEARSKSE